MFFETESKSLIIKFNVMRYMSGYKIYGSLIFVCTLLVFSMKVSSQKITNKDLQMMINTELAFAKLAKDSCTRTAFLAYLADESVMFGGGQPHNGKKQYEKMTKNESLLSWEPVYADISASGDFGYDTGPWEYRKTRSDDQPAYYGDFVSVWQKQPDGAWQLMVDLGISHSKPEGESPKLRTTALIPKSVQPNQHIDFKSELISREKDFIKSFSQAGDTAYISVISGEARFFRDGLPVLVNSHDIKQMLLAQNKNKKITYTLINGDAASSGDLGYVYGMVTIESTDGANKKIQNTNYQRIWKKEDGKNWKIIADVITGN
jgi:ketosteroid isomerase-like protein